MLAGKLAGSVHAGLFLFLSSSSQSDQSFKGCCRSARYILVTARRRNNEEPVIKEPKARRELDYKRVRDILWFLGPSPKCFITKGRQSWCVEAT